MMETKILITIIVTLLVLDLLWLGIIAKNFYAKELRDKIKSPPNWTAAILVYILLIIGIYLFVFHNTLATSKLSIVILGAILGIVIYGVYELTNLALIKDWPIKMVLVDIIWGMILGGTTSFIGSLFK